MVLDFEHLQSQLIDTGLYKEDGMFSTGSRAGCVKEMRVSELEISSSELEAAYKEHSALEPLWSDIPHVTEHRQN